MIRAASALLAPGTMRADFRERCPRKPSICLGITFTSSGLPALAERRREFASGCHPLGIHDKVDDAIDLQVFHSGARKLAELLDHILVGRELLFAAARRFHGLFVNLAVLEPDLDTHLVPVARSQRCNL